MNKRALSKLDVNNLHELFKWVFDKNKNKREWTKVNLQSGHGLLEKLLNNMRYSPDTINQSDNLL